MDTKTLSTLRIGDTVRIHFTHMGARDGARSQPFDVVITGFHNTGKAYKDEDGQYYESRQINWCWRDMPVELQPDERVRDDIRGIDGCHVDHIIEIVKRAPYQVRSHPRNVLYAAEQSAFLDHQKVEKYRQENGEDPIDVFGRRSMGTTAVGYIFEAYNETYLRDIRPSQYNGHVFKLAEALIARRPTLAVPTRLDVDRFYAAWYQAGCPGKAGPYEEYRYSDNVDPSPFKALINRKAFTKWVVRNVYRFIMTQADILKNMIQAAKDEEEYMRKSMDEDMEREFGRSDYVSSHALADEDGNIPDEDIDDSDEDDVLVIDNSDHFYI
jgi:hypothetical protein